METNVAIKNILINKIAELNAATGQEVSAEQFQSLLNVYLNAYFNEGKTLEQIEYELTELVNKKIRYFKFLKNKEKIFENYKSGVKPFEGDENCYLVSYRDGKKEIRPANLMVLGMHKTDSNKVTKVVIDRDMSQTGFKKNNSTPNHTTEAFNQLSSSDDLELVINQSGYILGVDMAKTHRIYDEHFRPLGLLSENVCKEAGDELYSFASLYDLVVNNSTDEKVKDYLMHYASTYPLKQTFDISSQNELDYYKIPIDFSIAIIEGLPGITPEEKEKLKQQFFDMKVLEVFTDSIDGKLENYGIVANFLGEKPVYKFEALFDKANDDYVGKDPNKMFFNNFICNKRLLTRAMLNYYYPYVKPKLSNIATNNEEIISGIDSVASSFLDYWHYNSYHDSLVDNARMISQELANAKTLHLEEDADISLEEQSQGEMSTSRSRQLQSGQSVRKTKGNTLVLANGNAPSIIDDDSGKIDVKFITIVLILIIVIFYIFLKFFV